VLVAKPDLWGKLLREAESLAEHHTPTIGSRSLDILHVAAALVLGATEFCTLDTRQGKLAQLAGLHVQPYPAMQRTSTPLTAFHFTNTGEH
jgi:hypothetical protein